jgi:hypothetical protein
VVIQTLRQDVRNKLQQVYDNWRFRKDLYVVAVSYAPIDEKYQTFINNKLSTQGSIIHVHDEQEPDISTELDVDEIENLTITSVSKALQKGQIFLGMIGLGRDPKNGIQQWIENLGDNSGIRFIYASPKNEQRSKAFGKKLGVDTVRIT